MCILLASHDIPQDLTVLNSDTLTNMLYVYSYIERLVKTQDPNNNICGTTFTVM